MKILLMVNTALVAALFLGCAKLPIHKKVIKPTTVKTVETKRGISVIKNERAERSIVDNGSASRLPAQKYSTISDYFGSYNIRKNGTVVVSKYNITNDNRVRSSDIWFFGRGKARLTNTSYYNSNPSMSQNGKFVYFVSNRGKNALSNYDQTSYIWRMSSKGNGGLTRIGTAMNHISNPLESPDGTKLLFSAKEFGGQKSMIWYMGKNGEMPTQLKSGKQATWLNNKTIVFTAKDPGTGLYSIWRMNLDGSLLTQIIADKNLHCIHPSPSPDGKLIAFVKQNGTYTNKRDIYIYNSVTGLVDQMTTNKSRDDLPRWSKDQKHIYFRSSRGLSWNVWRIQVDAKK
jgi:Tol biopolymer transport system component